MRLATTLIALCVLAVGIAPGAFAETAKLDAVLGAEGYVSVPVTRGPDRRHYVEGMIHGAKVRILLDLSNDNSLYDIRALRKLDVEFEKTEIVLPTQRKNVRIHTGRILGLELAGKSTGEMLIHAGDVDPVYNIKSGTDGPDVVLGLEFLSKHGALFDFKNQLLHLKLR